MLWLQNHWFIYRSCSNIGRYIMQCTFLCLPHDRHNVTNHFCPQAFLSKQSFQSLYVSYFSAIILCFRRYIAAGSNNELRTWAEARKLLISFTQPRCIWFASKIFSVRSSFFSARFWLLSSQKFQLVSSHQRFSVSNIMVNSEL